MDFNSIMVSSVLSSRVLLVVFGCLVMGNLILGHRIKSCPDNTVDRRLLLKYIATGESFLYIYGLEIMSSVTYNQTIGRIVLTDNSTVKFEISAYNTETSQCDTGTLLGQEIQEKEGSIRRKGCKDIKRDSYVVLADGIASNRFYSQAPCRYFWWFGCISGTVDSLESCKNGFVDLWISADRRTESGEIDLNGLPWDVISDDLKYLGTDFSSLRYTGLGPECSGSLPPLNGESQERMLRTKRNVNCPPI